MLFQNHVGGASCGNECERKTQIMAPKSDVCISGMMNFNAEDWGVSYKINADHPFPYLCTSIVKSVFTGFQHVFRYTLLVWICVYSAEIHSILWKWWHNCSGRDLQMKITPVRNALNWNIKYLNSNRSCNFIVHSIECIHYQCNWCIKQLWRQKKMSKNSYLNKIRWEMYNV